MTYDGLVLAAVIAELRKRIVGGRIQEIRQHNASDLTLEVRAPGHTYRVFFSVDARFPRVHLTSTSQPVPDRPPTFCMVMRKHLRGAFVSSIEQVGFDRVLKLRSARHDEPERVLIFEIMGKHSNLVLTDESGKILGAVKHIGSSLSRYRQILPGKDYQPPPGSNKLNPLELDLTSVDFVIRTGLREPIEPVTAREWLISNFAGFGPFLADEIVARTTDENIVNPERLRYELVRLADIVQRSDFEPVLITDQVGRAIMAYPIRSVRFPAEQQHPRDSINEPLEALFRSLVARTQLDDERSQTLVAIRRAIASRQQTMKSIERAIAESYKAERYRQIGELILASVHEIAKGDRIAKIIDFFDPDMPRIEVELDEKRTPQQNAERYFKRYQKAREAASNAEVRKNKVAQELETLETAFHKAESARTVDELRNLRETLVKQDLLRKETVAEKAEDEFEGHRVGRIRTADGWEILYGESSQANDYLTQRVARPDDVWLHARSITGAHVIIRTDGHSGGVPKHVLLQAAQVAAKNSEAKHSSLVPVDYTLKKYVRKPRGSAPGFVTYRNEKTIDVSPEK
ncbi:MAG: NFACT family protein [Armatimonadetes bacterium]|nr:NFACT family protein [Armatimonadota bacterium]